MGRVSEERYAELRRTGGETVEFQWLEDSCVEILRVLTQEEDAAPPENKSEEDQPIAEEPGESNNLAGKPEPEQVPAENLALTKEEQVAAAVDRFISAYYEAYGALETLIGFQDKDRYYVVRSNLRSAYNTFFSLPSGPTRR